MLILIEAGVDKQKYFFRENWGSHRVLGGVHHPSDIVGIIRGFKELPYGRQSFRQSDGPLCNPFTSPPKFLIFAKIGLNQLLTFKEGYMSNFKNHYETLNVSNDASLETIRASYHNLCKLFHPDLNPHMADGLEMIEELTASYEILKDPNSRQDYDLKYLIEMRRKATRTQVAAPAPAVQAERLPELPKEAMVASIQVAPAARMMELPRRESSSQSNGSALKVAAIAAIAIIGVAFVGYSMPNNMLSKISIFNLDKIVKTSNYVRPLNAPNGVAFPATSAYLSGYEQKNNQGSSSVLISNSKNEHDVYLKLISLEENKTTAVRHVFIKANSEFTIDKLSNGKYEIQYMDLVAGLAGKSETFSVSETQGELGVKSTNFSVTLQTATNGVLRVQNISIDDFNTLASL